MLEGDGGQRAGDAVGARICRGASWQHRAAPMVVNTIHNVTKHASGHFPSFSFCYGHNGVYPHLEHYALSMLIAESLNGL